MFSASVDIEDYEIYGRGMQTTTFTMVSGSDLHGCEIYGTKMTGYTIRIEGEFIEGIEANSEKEAEQLALRMLMAGLGSCPTQFSVVKITVCSNPKKKENQNGR